MDNKQEIKVKKDKDTGLFIPPAEIARKAEKERISRQLEAAGIKPEDLGPGISHLLLVKNNRAETRRFLKCLRKAKKLGINNMLMTIDHEADSSCCELEDFSITQRRVITKLLSKIEKVKTK